MPADWFQTLMEFVGSISQGTSMTLQSATTVQIVAGPGNDQVALAIEGKWRYISATVSTAHPGGTAGTYYVWAIASANQFTPGNPEIDTTDYTFGLAITSGAAPTGSYAGRAIAHTRRVAALTWDGATVTSIQALVGGAPVQLAPIDGPAGTPSLRTLGAGAQQSMAGNTVMSTAQIADGAVTTPKIPDGAVTTPKLADGAVTAPKIAAGTITADRLAAGVIPTSTTPPGAIIAFAGGAPPSGWLFCDGSAVSRVTYSALYAILGATFGAGDGSTTFNLPDLQGRVPVGKGTHVDVDTLGDSDGNALASRRPAHRHTVAGGYMIAGGVHYSAADAYKATPIYSGNTGTPTVGPQTLSPLDEPAYLTLNFLIKT